jgi:EpsI family protein
LSNRRFLTLAGFLVVGIVVSLLFGRLGHPFAAVGYRQLRRPLEDFPRRVGEWVGEESPLTAKEKRVLGMDHYLRRRYRNPDGREVVLYLCYYGNKQRGIEAIYHNATVCLPAAGWEHSGNEQRKVVPLESARPLDVSLDSFRAAGAEVVILSFFIINGEIVERPPRNKPLWLGWDKLRLSRDPGYFAQVQIVSRRGPDDRNAAGTAQEFLEEAGHYIFLHF